MATNARVTQQYLEVGAQTDSNVRVTQQYLEVGCNAKTSVVVTQQYLEAGCLYEPVVTNPRIFPVPQAQRLGQSQEGKRVFPV